MSVDNHTPFPAIAFRQYNLAGNLNGVVAVRGTFKLSDGGPLALARDQFPLVLSDEYDGDPHHAPQMACTDLAPFKPATDVTFVGASFAPDGAPTRSWSCGLTVGPVSKRLRVTGPRVWRARTRKTWRGLLERRPTEAFDGWTLSEPEPATMVPIDWRLSVGGRLPTPTEEAPDGVHPSNTVGCGVVDDARFRDAPDVPAPQIEAEGRPLSSPHGEDSPEGFGPISPFWRQRTQYAGTYDQTWLDERHPLLPRDFDFRFWQCAHPDLIADPWLRGDETYELENLVPEHPKLEGRLPGVRMEIEIDQGDGPRRGLMVLDGVHFDLRPGIGRVFLTWRTAFPWPERRGMPRLTCVSGLPEPV